MRAVPRYDVITFDCYGTLIDWESGIANAFLTTAAADGVTLTREAVLRAYAENEHRVQAQSYRSYRDILRDTAVRVAATASWALTPERADFLADSLPSWQPFPDTNAALGRLAAISRLGILSNIDDDLLAATREHFTVDFDVIVTAQQVRSYKPGHAHFQTARELIGPTSWLHAAESNFHDIVPTNTLGIDNAWINRQLQRELPGGTPKYKFDDLAGLAEAMS
ncbi:MAG: putative hydrolase of the superfamily [Thermoanaerobaculia bacterium]|jgi:2-haloacid dehalogenase/putative hydrolase of the HAD superfamily|nr:putative hydrolase of the superfamily [Thermoanaerobaculia bacterium]